VPTAGYANANALLQTVRSIEIALAFTGGGYFDYMVKSVLFD
jgi:hypothetical protein